jgi:hypothetical protein
MVCTLDVPIRVLGIVTSIIWVLLIAVIAISAYSRKDLSIQIDPPTPTFGQNHELILSTSVRINNTGSSDLKELNLTTQVFDPNGIELSKSCSSVAVVPQHENVTILHNITLSVDKLLQNDSQFLFEDSNLTMTMFGGVSLAGLLPSTISSNMTLPWGAPLYNFSLGKPQFSLFNNTHSLLTIPISFENHAWFNVAGNLKVGAYGTDNVVQFEGQTDVNALAKCPYNDGIELYAPVQTNGILAFSGGHFEVTFSSDLCNYGPWVIPFG